MHRALVLALSVALLAGCASPDAGDGGAGDVPAGAIPTRLTYGDCDELLGAFPVQEDAIALPEGFAPAPLLGQGTGAIFVVGWQCAGAAADANASETTPFVEAFAGFSVTPPAELALEGAFAHAILIGLTTGSPLAVSTYQAWRIPVVADAVAFEWTAAPSGAPVGGGRGALEGPVGLLDVSMQVNAGGPNTPEAGSAVRFFATEGDVLVAAYDIAWTDADGFQGPALSTAALPGAPPATTGLGFYYTSDEPERYVMTPFALPPADAES